MGILRKSTPHKREAEIVPDESDSMQSFVEEPYAFEGEATSRAGGATASDDDAQEGQLAVDEFQTADEIVIVAPIAGVKREDFSITITDEILTVKGKRRFSFNVDSADYITKECFWGNFGRAIILPESIDTAQVKASFKNGILTIRIPKVEKIITRMIKINEE